MGLLSGEPAQRPEPEEATVLSFRPRPAPYADARGLTASASRVSLMSRRDAQQIRQQQTVAQAWQARAWRGWRKIGDVNYAFGLIATYLSRVRIHAAVVANPSDAPVEVGEAIFVRDSKDQIKGVAGGVDPRLAIRARELIHGFVQDGLSEMLQAFATNMQVPGECYLCQIDGRWSVRSTSELKVDASGTARLYPSAVRQTAGRVLPSTTAIGRIWQRDPEHSWDATSSMVPVLDDCDEYILLCQMVRNVTKSRLNAGMLFVPDGFTVAAQTVSDDDTEPGAEVVDNEDSFEQELMTLVVDPIANENSASAAIPMLVRGPAEQGAAIKQISLGSSVDEQLVNERAKVLDHIVTSIHAPKDSVGGMRGLKYANAMMVDQQTYKAHVEPLAMAFCVAVTDIFLRPILVAEQQTAGWDPEQVERVVVWYDPSEITARPDRGTDADAGYDRKALSEAAWRREHGFSDADAPDETELARRAVFNAPLPPDAASALIHFVFADVFKAAQQKLADGGTLPPALAQALGGSQQIDQTAPTEPVDPNAAGTPPTPSAQPTAPADSSLGTPDAAASSPPSPSGAPGA